MDDFDTPLLHYVISSLSRFSLRRLMPEKEISLAAAASPPPLRRY